MKALFIGSATVDINATCNALHPTGVTHHRHTEKCLLLAFASKTQLDDIELTSGGSAANSAVACERLGTKTRLVSAVGDDFFSDLILSDLRKFGVDTSGVKRFAKAKTSTGINLLCHSGEKTNLIFKGATDLLGPANLQESWIQESDALVLTSLASGKNWKLLIKANRLAERFGKIRVFAPSITMLRNRKKELSGWKGDFDVAVFNFEEAGFFLDCHNPVDDMGSLPGKINVVTHDTHGSFVYDQRHIWHVPTLKVPVRDTTGAGDAFTGALVHGILEKKGTVASVQFASAVACLKIQHLGAKLTQSRTAIHDFFRKNQNRLKPKKIF